MGIKDKLDEIGQFVINELGKELIKQDHKATGELIASLDYNISIYNSKCSLFWTNYYKRLDMEKINKLICLKKGNSFIFTKINLNKDGVIKRHTYRVSSVSEHNGFFVVGHNMVE